MLNRKDTERLESLIRREQDIIKRYEECMDRLTDPQLRSDLQNLTAQHRNQYNSMIRTLEGSCEQ